MSKFLLIMALSSIGFAAPKVPETAPIRYRHIQDQDGKILATIDTKNGTIDYKESPKVVVEQLIKIADGLSQSCQAQLAALKKQSKGEIKK